MVSVEALASAARSFHIEPACKKSGAQNGGTWAPDNFGSEFCAGGGKDPGVAVSAYGGLGYQSTATAHFIAKSRTRQ